MSDLTKLYVFKMSTIVPITEKESKIRYYAMVTRSLDLQTPVSPNRIVKKYSSFLKVSRLVIYNTTLHVTICLELFLLHFIFNVLQVGTCVM